MLLLLAAFLASASMTDDELAQVMVAPPTWAVAISAWREQPVDSRHVRRVTCVGLEDARMLCSWQQRTIGSWRAYSAWADMSKVGAPRILEAAEAVGH